MVFAWKNDAEFEEKLILIQGGGERIGEERMEGYYYSGVSNEYDHSVRLSRNFMMTADMLSVHLYNRNEEQLAKNFSI